MAEKTTKHTLRNTATGPRGVNAHTGYVEIQPGQTVENVELTAPELKSAEDTGYFDIDDAADDQDDAAEPLPGGLAALKKLAKAGGVTVSGTTAADYQTAILAHRAQAARANDDLDKLSDADLRNTVAAITGTPPADDATRADLLTLARGQ